jgi:hypothetical protein
MAQFTTSAKPIQYYRESTLINKFAAAVGDRCERLTQSERYQLATCMSTYCHAYCELDEDEDLETLMEVYWSTVSTEMTGNVIACLWMLDGEEPDAIAAILPAISEYAQNEYVEEEVDHEMFGGDLVLSALTPSLRESQA